MTLRVHPGSAVAGPLFLLALVSPWGMLVGVALAGLELLVVWLLVGRQS